ncbi:MAG: hypothetical protein J0I06_20915 [Planctomycetes bacterium]|nr:hypothetical protein [Planctomycetota bacterium]
MRTTNGLGAGVLAGLLVVTAAAAQDPPVGKPPKGWNAYVPASKAFGVWLPDGRKSEQSREATYDGAKLKISMVVVETKDKALFRAEQVSLPVKAGQKVDPERAIELFRDLFVKDVDGLVTADADVKLGKMPGKEYVMDAGKNGRAKLRVYVAGPRVYMISMIGTKEQIEGASAKVFFDSFKHQGMVKDDEKKGAGVVGGPPTGGPPVPANRGPRTVGGGFDREVADKAPGNGYLVGVEVGLGKFGPNDTVIAVQPVFRTGDKDTAGKRFGTDVSRPAKVVAKPGYAVGAITVKTGLGVDGFSLTFMKVTDGKLDPKDSYESEWVGGKGGGPPAKLGGDGTLVVGLLAKENDKNVTGLGLMYAGEKLVPGKTTPIAGGGFDPEFRDGPDAGGLLVGLEVGLGKFFNNDVIRAVRPIFREGGKEVLGEQRGTELNRVVRVVAKPGYAVGAITTKSGLGLDGFSVTFMKVAEGGKLDPKDSYESEWIGGMGGGGPTKHGGDGTPVIGIVGKANKKDLTGLGLLLKEPEKK